MTRIIVKVGKVKDLKIIYNETGEQSGEIIFESETDEFPEIQGLVVPGGTNLTGLRKVARFLADMANFVILQLQFQM